MAGLRWSMEAVIAGVALLASGSGALYNGVYKASQWDSVAAHQKEQDAKIDDESKLGVRIDQKLDDAIDRLGRIERKLDK